MVHVDDRDADRVRISVAVRRHGQLERERLPPSITNGAVRVGFAAVGFDNTTGGPVTWAHEYDNASSSGSLLPLPSSVTTVVRSRSDRRRHSRPAARPALESDGVDKDPHQIAAPTAARIRVDADDVAGIVDGGKRQAVRPACNEGRARIDSHVVASIEVIENTPDMSGCSASYVPSGLQVGLRPPESNGEDAGSGHRAVELIDGPNHDQGEDEVATAIDVVGQHVARATLSGNRSWSRRLRRLRFRQRREQRLRTVAPASTFTILQRCPGLGSALRTEFAVGALSDMTYDTLDMWALCEMRALGARADRMELR